jgi:hypothetical protein
LIGPSHPSRQPPLPAARESHSRSTQRFVLGVEILLEAWRLKLLRPTGAQSSQAPSPSGVDQP